MRNATSGAKSPKAMLRVLKFWKMESRFWKTANIMKVI